MKVYIFGNEDIPEDAAAFTVAEKLQGVFPGIEFETVRPNEDLPFAGQAKVILMDTAAGINEVTVIDETELDKLTTTRWVTAHDYDLGFQLRLLIKLEKLKKVTVICLPQQTEIDYERIQSILRKLVEQDMQGS